MPTEYYGRTYRDSNDPLASWMVLRSKIHGLRLARLNALLAREAAGRRRIVIMRALTGRINAIKAARTGRGINRIKPNDHAAQRAELGLPSRSRRKV